MQETLHENYKPISLGVRPICNLRFADIDLTGGGDLKRQDFLKRLVDKAMVYGIEVGEEKKKIVTNSANTVSADISMNGHKLEVSSTRDRACTRIASAMAAMAPVTRIWRSNTTSFASKFEQYKSQV